jgi:mannan endo-1,4-beta-mannosidase
MTPPSTKSGSRSASRQKARRTRRQISIIATAVVLVGASIAVVVIKPWTNSLIHPTQSVRYLGVYEPGAPKSYADVDQFAGKIGRQPNLVSYYSPWLESFQTGFVTSAAQHGALTVVQIDPENVSLSGIAAGKYDSYLHSYAAAVRAYGSQVILSFGHEMNGNWYSWANQHTSAKVFVAAWRHIVTVFRAAGAGNATWMWTVNVIDESIPIPDPSAWWPGGSYVNWVGIDGYYFLSSQSFAQVFGPTIVAVLKLTKDPVLIAETGAAPAADQSAKINDLFAGVRSYGLIGFVWFDEDTQGRIWRISSPGAFAAFRQDAKDSMHPPASSATPAQLPADDAVTPLPRA